MTKISKIAAIATAAVLSLSGYSTTVQAQSSEPSSDEVIRSVTAGCQRDLQSYCSSVTPGRNRILACLYSHQDEISASCLQSLYNNAPYLQRAIASMQQVAAACQAELQTRCANAAPGNGRIGRCLRSDESQLSPGCRQAVQNLSPDE